MSETAVIKYKEFWYVAIIPNCNHINKVMTHGKKFITKTDAVLYARMIDNTTYGIHVYS